MSNNITRAAKALEYMRTTEPVWKIDHIEERFMGADGKIYFRVQWEDGTYTDEPRDKLIREVRGMVQQFERAHPVSGGRRRKDRTRKHRTRKHRTCKHSKNRKH